MDNTPNTDNHWERWRGQVNAQLAALKDATEKIDSTCRACRGNVDSQFGNLYEQLHKEVALLNAKVQKIEVRIAWIAGAAALVGSGASKLFEWLMQ